MSNPEMIITWTTPGNRITRGHTLASEFERMEGGEWVKVFENNRATRACLEEIKRLRSDLMKVLEREYRERERWLEWLAAFPIGWADGKRITKEDE